MTRKDYIMLAEALASARPSGEDCGNPERTRGTVDQYARDCEAIADALAENPRFDRARFLRACGVQS
jgi:hypothetical protein